MDLSEVREEAIIFDGKERKIIRGGKEYPITEEEYRKLYPLHEDIGCKDCTFVTNLDSVYYSKDQVGQLEFTTFDHIKIFLGLLNPDNKVVSLGLFITPGQTNHSYLYLFRCYECGQLVVDHMHGKARLQCMHDGCGSRRHITNSAILRKNNRQIPSFYQRWLGHILKS